MSPPDTAPLDAALITALLAETQALLDELLVRCDTLRHLRDHYGRLAALAAEEGQDG